MRTGNFAEIPGLLNDPATIRVNPANPAQTPPRSLPRQGHS